MTEIRHEKKSSYKGRRFIFYDLDAIIKYKPITKATADYNNERIHKHMLVI